MLRIIIAIVSILVLTIAFTSLLFLFYDAMITRKLAKESFENNEVIQLHNDNVSVHLINLKRNPDRLHRFQSQFMRSDLKNIPFKRIDAVDGKTIDVSQYVAEEAYKDLLTAERTGYRLRHYELTRGAVGCYLSHIKALEEAKTSDKDYALIFEDDVRFLTNNVLHDLNQQLHHIPSNWDMLLLGCVCYVCGKYRSHYDANRFILLHAYIVKKTSLPKLIELLKGNPIKQQLDAEISDLIGDNKLKVYCLRKKIAMQWSMGTNIQLPVIDDPNINPFETFDAKNMS